MADLSQIKEEFYAIVNQPSTSSVYPSSASGGSFVENLANNMQDEICRSRKWQFLKKKFQFNTGIKTQLSGPLVTTDVSIAVEATDGWPTIVTSNNFALYIEGDIVNFTGRVGNTLNGLTNIDIDHATGAQVELLYAIPSDYSHVPRLFLQETGFDRMIEYTQIDEDEDDVLSYSIHNYNPGGILKRWSIATDKNANRFIRLSNSPGTQHIATFRYFKSAVDMVDDSDLATIPDPFAIKIIPKFMAAKAMMTRGDNPDGLADSIMAMANNELLKMKKYYGFADEDKMFATPNKYRSGVILSDRRVIIR